MHGYHSRDGIAPFYFLQTRSDEALRYGAQILNDRVIETRIAADGTFDLRLQSGATMTSRALLIATGLTDQLPDIPGLRDRWGTLVHHCPYCHGFEVRDKNIVVIGGAAKEVSMKQAGLLRRYSDRMTFVTNQVDLTNDERYRLQAFGIVITDGAVSHLIGAPGELDGIGLTDGRTLQCEAAFVAPRPQPNDQILHALACDTDALSGLVKTDLFGQTSVTGVWAAGNVVTPTAQVISAAGAGSAAAIAINGWLLQQDLDAATAARH
jgi:thioredoxin reductase